PSRFTSLTLPPDQLLPGGSPTGTQIIDNCAAKTTSWIRDESLSPLWDAEFVNPDAILSFQRCSNQSGNVASMKALNTADTLPIKVGAPKMIASDSSNVFIRDSFW